MTEECAGGIIDTLLQIEGFDGVIRSYPIRFNNIDHERIEHIELQQRLMNSILERLTRSIKEDVFVKIFEDILGLDSNTDEFPVQFFVLLTRKEFLKCIVRPSFTTTNSPRLQQLGVCVLTKILEYCQEEKNTLQSFLNALFNEHCFVSQMHLLLTFNLEACSASEAKSLDESSNTIVVVLNFYVQLLHNIKSMEGTGLAKELIDSVFSIILKCLRLLSGEEDVVQLCVELVDLCLDNSNDGDDNSSCFIKDGTYRILFDILSSHPYEGTILIFFSFVQVDNPKKTNSRNLC
jgi:hypothetical protein